MRTGYIYPQDPQEKLHGHEPENGGTISRELNKPGGEQKGDVRFDPVLRRAQSIKKCAKPGKNGEGKTRRRLGSSAWSGREAQKKKLLIVRKSAGNRKQSQAAASKKTLVKSSREGN